MPLGPASDGEAVYLFPVSTLEFFFRVVGLHTHRHRFGALYSILVMTGALLHAPLRQAGAGRRLGSIPAGADDGVHEPEDTLDWLGWGRSWHVSVAVSRRQARALPHGRLGETPRSGVPLRIAGVGSNSRIQLETGNRSA